MLIDDLPKAAMVRIIRHALKHQRCRAIAKRAIYNVAMTRNPADVSRAPIDVAGLIIEHQLMGEGGIDHIATRRMLHAFWLAR